MKPRAIRVNRRVKLLPVGRPTLPGLLTVPEVAERLRCTTAHIYALIARGDLGAVKVGAKRLVTEDQLLGFIERNTIEAAS